MNFEKNEKKTLIEKAYDYFSDLGWPGLLKEEKRISINGADEYVLFEEDEQNVIINLLWYNRRDNSFGQRGGIEKIIINKKIDFRKLFYLGNGKYNISYLSQIRSVLDTNSDIKTIIVKTGNNKKITKDDKSITIYFKKLLEIQSEAGEAYKKSKSYAGSVERYLLNGLSEKYINREVKNKTTIEKGEFNFITHRFNLETKKNKDDCKKYLNDKDINSLQDLFFFLTDKDVFSNDFLRKLDDYFIREKLKDIIYLGKEIMSIGQTNLETDKAKEIIEKVAKSKKKIKQLESVWQEYFKKYLLYLIFSYKEIYPKIELELDSEKKFPDFVGVNHYNGIDAIEIKTHLTPALVWDSSHKNFAFSPELSKAIIQTMNYMDAIKRRRFKNDSDREKITETTHEENLYRPRGIIIISSNTKLVKGRINYDRTKIERDFTKLRNSLHNIEILTFNEVIDTANNYANKIFNKQKTT